MTHQLGPYSPISPRDPDAPGRPVAAIRRAEEWALAAEREINHDSHDRLDTATAFAAIAQAWAAIAVNYGGV
jgi:hypothetical protein